MGRAGRLRGLHRHVHRRTRINNEHTHTHNASRGYFPPRYNHRNPAPESKPETTRTTFAAWRVVVDRPNRYHSIPNHLPPNKMIYEPAIEPECPIPAYDPAMDEPEPPAPRRKPPFETLRVHIGQVHTLNGQTRLYTGRYTFCGEIHKYAGIGIKYARHEPIISCDRKSAAKMLRTLRKGGVC
jgi:hypothetical protein